MALLDFHLAILSFSCQIRHEIKLNFIRTVEVDLIKMKLMKHLLLTLLLCSTFVMVFGQITVPFTPIPNSILTTTASNPVYSLDIAYDNIATDDAQSFDLFLPDTVGSHPLVIYIHGGGFTGGDKSSMYQVGARLDELGFFLDNGLACVSINYRLLPSPNSPDLGTDQDGVGKCLNDSRRALQFIRYHSDALHIDSDKVAVYGGSAGAGTSLWIGMKDDMAEVGSSDPVLDMSTRVCAVAVKGTQCTYDFYKWETDVFDNFDGNGTNFTMDSLEALFGFDRYNDFYGGIIDSTYDLLYDPALIQYRHEVDMLGALDSSDPPLYIETTNVSTHPAQDPLHHWLHSVTLNDYAIAANLPEVKANIASQSINTTNGESNVEFLKRHLESCILTTNVESQAQDDKTGLTIYPNPATNEFTISYKGESQIASISLLSLDGKLISTQSRSRIVDVSDVAKGIAIVRVDFEDGKQVFDKVVIH